MEKIIIKKKLASKKIAKTQLFSQLIRYVGIDYFRIT